MDNSSVNFNGIVIFGEMGSGKDALADELMSLSSQCIKYNLSDLVRAIKPVFAVEPAWRGLERTKYQEYVDKLREFDADILNKYCLGVIYTKLQKTLGLHNTESSEEDFKKQLLKDLSLVRNYEIPIIVGGRTIRDYDFWKDKNYLVTGIVCDRDIRFERLVKRDGYEVAKNSSSAHNTEVMVPHIVNNLCDVVIDNNGTFEDLRRQAVDLLRSL